MIQGNCLFYFGKGAKMGPNSKILFSFIFLKESTFFKVVKHDKNLNIVCVCGGGPANYSCVSHYTVSSNLRCQAQSRDTCTCNCNSPR